MVTMFVYLILPGYFSAGKEPEISLEQYKWGIHLSLYRTIVNTFEQ